MTWLMRVVSNTSPISKKLAGNIPSLKSEIDRLRNECGFFLAKELETVVLQRVGEKY